MQEDNVSDRGVDGLSDMDLLRRYAEEASSAAFRGIVERHVSLVYSVCLRRLKDARMAEDATLEAFSILGGSARSLVRWSLLRKPSLSVFLYETAVDVTGEMIREDTSASKKRQVPEMSKAPAESRPTA